MIAEAKISSFFRENKIKEWKCLIVNKTYLECDYLIIVEVAEGSMLESVLVGGSNLRDTFRLWGASLAAYHTKHHQVSRRLRPRLRLRLKTSFTTQTPVEEYQSTKFTFPFKIVDRNLQIGRDLKLSNFLNV